MKRDRQIKWNVRNQTAADIRKKLVFNHTSCPLRMISHNNLKKNRPSLDTNNVELSFLHPTTVTFKHWSKLGSKATEEFYLRTRYANMTTMAWGSWGTINKRGRVLNNLPDLWFCVRWSWALHSPCGTVTQDLVKATCLKSRLSCLY